MGSEEQLDKNFPLEIFFYKGINWLYWPRSHVWSSKESSLTNVTSEAA